MGGFPLAILPYDPFLQQDLAAYTPTASLPYLIATNATELLSHIATLNASGPGTILCVPGTYAMTATGVGGAAVTITQPGIHILGAGERASIIDFTPTAADQICFKYDNGGGGAGQHAQWSFGGFSFRSSDVALRKIFIDFLDAERPEIHHLHCVGGAWTGNNSVGMISRGRQQLYLHDATLYVDLPLHIKHDTRVAAIDTDHYRVERLEMSAEGNPCILADADVVFTNATFRDLAFVRGTDGFRWDGTSANASNAMLFENIRREQELSAGAFYINIGGTTRVNSLRIVNCAGANAAKGIKLRGAIQNCTIENFFYVGTSVAIDADGVDQMILVNSYTGNPSIGASVSIANMKRTFAATPGAQTTPTRPFEIWASTATSSYTTGIVLDGLKYRIFNNPATGGPITLADAAQYNFIPNFAGTEKCIILTIVANRADTGQPVGGLILATGGAGGGGMCPTPTATFDHGNVPGKLTALWQSNVNIVLLNQLGVSVDFIATMTWV